MNTQPVCLLDNEKDLLSVLSSPGYSRLSGKAIIVDESSDLAVKALRFISQTKQVNILRYEVCA